LPGGYPVVGIIALIMFLLGVSVHGQDEPAVAMTVVKRITKLQITPDNRYWIGCYAVE
jgi:hypothetical protein